jgi:hypothetical protein
MSAKDPKRTWRLPHDEGQSIDSILALSELSPPGGGNQPKNIP